MKVCGLTRIEDALTAVEAGADALGFVFERSSKRYIGEHWPELCRHLPPFVYRVGVFGPPPETIPDGLHAVQALWAEATRLPEGIDLICTVRCGPQGVPDLGFARSAGFRAILLDAYDPSAYGGTGRTVDFRAAGRAAEACPLPVILAGGLNPYNVAEAVRQARPFAVDVSTGVETAPGQKSADLIRRFVDAAKSSL